MEEELCNLPIMVNPKKRGGAVGDLISGTGGLIIGVIIVLVIVSTLLAANLLGGDLSSSSINVVSEKNAWANSSTYRLGGNLAINGSRSTYAITGASNNSATLTIAFTNYTLNSVTGVVVNSTATHWSNVTYNYSYVQTIPDTTYQNSANDMGLNLTVGIGNVSSKIPTILLIAAVVLLFGVLVILVRQAGAMGIGGTGTL